MLGLGQQGAQHIIVLPLHGLLREARRMRAEQIAANRLGALGVLGRQGVEDGTGVGNGGHLEHSGSRYWLRVWLLLTALH
ncbi:hypothetical protein D3C72_2017370 [compost metagenome]